ncbi:FG-GAP repeat domain-containing protein [Dictyobacter aurantiacus]|nr:VCBS repeat-containing protein [Dictyobacter aurantiacus]
MPTLESTERIAPKSILRHRPIEGGSGKKQASDSVAGIVTPVPRASRPSGEVVVAAEQQERGAMPKESSQEGWRMQETTAGQGHHGKDTATRHMVYMDLSPTRVTRVEGALRRSVRYRPRQLVKVHTAPARPFWFYLLIGMTGTLLLWMVLSTAAGWFSTWMDDLHYGRPRTFQTDARVGHNEQRGLPSHFIALNLHRRIEIIEFAGGDPAQARIFMGPELYHANDELVPVELKFADLNNDGKPDMVVLYQGQHLVYINDGKSFRLSTQAEQDGIEQALQHLGW